MNQITPNHFFDTVALLREGKTAHELSDTLGELIGRVLTSKRGGSLTLTLKVHPGADGSIEIRDSLKCALPPTKHQATPLFKTEAGAMLPGTRNPELPGLVPGSEFVNHHQADGAHGTNGSGAEDPHRLHDNLTA